MGKRVLLVVALALPCLLASCSDPAASVPQAAFSPCTLVRYSGPRYAVLELRVREHAETVYNNVETDDGVGGFVRLGEGVYLARGWEIVDIGGC